MSSVMDRVFGNFDGADPNGAGSNPYINGHSVNVVEIQKVKIRESQNGPKVFLVIEYIVKETNRSTGPDAIKVDDLVYAWVHDLTNQYFGMSNAKAFLAAVVGLDAESDEAKSLGREAMEEAYSEDQPFTGIMVGLTTTTKETKGTGKEFTVHTWTPHLDYAETTPAGAA